MTFQYSNHRFFVLFLMLSSLNWLPAQILTPVHWSQSVKELDSGEYELVFSAKMDDGWAIYSQTSDPNAAAPTEITIKAAPHFQLLGKALEKGELKKGPEPLFDNLVVAKYYHQVDFVQKIKVKDTAIPIEAEVYFMSCNSEKCIPPSPQAFSFNLGKSQNQGGLPTDAQVVSTAKLLDPVKVTMKTEAEPNQSHKLIFDLKMDEGWSVYSNKIGPDGPIPTTVDFEQGSHFKTKGELQEESDHRIEGFDDIFEMNLVKFKESVTMTQEIEVTDPQIPVKGSITFQACDATKCLPPKTLAFTFHPSSSKLEFEGMGTGVGMNVPPSDFKGGSIDQTNEHLRKGLLQPLGDCGEELTKSDNHLWTFIFGFLGGLLALLTPCVFPMIPLTVSFFTKDSRKSGIRNAIIYSLSIIFIYVTIGLLITAVFGATALNELSTNWVANLIFFIIFVVFAFSFFGYFEITLPSSWTSKSDKLSDTGGIIGIFFMAFTLALVSFSCTGPIVGSALVESAKSTTGPFLVMLGFSLALAIPFGFFAAFPAWLNSLPKSGSWMTNVKVVLGFLELALALKFLSNADMSRKWNVLPYEVFMALWVILFALMTLYLFGLIRFPHDSPVKKLSALRLIFAVAALAMTLYLGSGFIYNKEVNSYRSLNVMSGIAPPSTYNLFLPEAELNPELKSRFISFTKCANNLDCFKDYTEGLSYAKETNKPILLDYTGIFCQNCRRTEDRIWVADKVRNLIANQFVLVSLYCDDPKELSEKLLSIPRNTVLRTIGNKWADHQILNFEQNSQPHYVLISPEEEILARPRGYRDGVDSYSEFLECGLKAHKKI